MLIQFHFSNFKSFRDSTYLDMMADKITELESHLIQISGYKILPLASIFGGNASGKTNALDAFRYMNYYVLNSFSFGGEEGKDKIPFHPFAFDSQSSQGEAVFEAVFTIPGDYTEKAYQYGFAMDEKQVAEEWLLYKTKTGRQYKEIFYRNQKTNEMRFPGIPKAEVENINIALYQEVLIVSLGAKLKVKPLKVVYDWFRSNRFVNFGSPQEDFLVSHLAPPDIMNTDVQKRITKFLQSFDPSILGITVEKAIDIEKDRYQIYTLHKRIDSDEMVRLNLAAESAGTQKMFALYNPIVDILNKGGVLITDELDSKLHPLLMRKILNEFSNPKINSNHAQILFTVHDPWLLNSGALRRDEIWFTEKDEQGISSLYSLADFKDEHDVKIRKDENYEKNYLLGKYGAIPWLQYYNYKEGNADQ